MLRPFRSPLIPFPVLLAVAACGPRGDETVPLTGTRVVERPVRLGLPTDERFDMRDPAPRRAPEPLFAWDVPAGWTERPASQFRLGSFATPGDGDCSISTSGGSLELNINRWRQQLGLAEVGAGEIAVLPRRAVGRFGEVVVVELTGHYRGMGRSDVPDAKLLGIVSEISEDLSLFVKLVGPAATVDAERERFFELAASLRPSEHVAAAVADQAFDPGALRWSLPDTWAVVPSSSSFRIVTVAPQQHPELQCWVTVLGGTGGGLAGNVNRWRGEVGEPALDAAGLASLPRLRVLGTEARLVEAYGDYRGQDGERTDSGLLGAVALLGSHAVFVKMVGPADLVRAEKARFVEFCESLES